MARTYRKINIPLPYLRRLVRGALGGSPGPDMAVHTAKFDDDTRQLTIYFSYDSDVEDSSTWPPGAACPAVPLHDFIVLPVPDDQDYQ